MKININDIKDQAALYCLYEGQFNAQPVYIALDLRDGALSMDYDGNVGGGTTPEIHYGVVRTYPVNGGVPTASAANALLRDLAPLAQRVLDGAGVSVDYRNGNRVGALDDNAHAAEVKIVEAINTSTYPVVWDWAGSTHVEDWLTDIRADMSDDDLIGLHNQMISQFQYASEDGFAVYSGDLLAELTEERDSLRAAATVDQG
jgi:hypothetical protein